MKNSRIITLILTIIMITFAQPLPVQSANYSTHTMTVIVTSKLKESADTNISVATQKGDGASEYATTYIIADQFRYKLLDTTVISEKEQIITVEKLYTPCKAKISYQVLNNGNRNLISLKVLVKKAGANRKWSEQDPD